MARISSTLRKLGKVSPTNNTAPSDNERPPQKSREFESDETAHDRYRRKQARLADQDGSTSLPVKMVDRSEEDRPRPGSTFEGPVEKLIEKYKDPREVVRHMTSGQYMKYELRGGEIWQGEELIYDGTPFMQDDK
jgi:hypothetical protein